MRVAPRPGAVATLLAAALAAGLPAPAPAQAPQNALAEDGLFVKVQNPITSEAVGRIRNEVLPRRDHDTRPVRKVVFDFNPNGADALTPNVGPCLDLAAFIRNELKNRNVTAVAFVHGKVAGHAVLPVLACNDLVMKRDATLGPVAADGVPPLNGPDRAAYDFYLNRPALLAVVQKMADPDMPLGKGLKTQTDWYLDLRRADEAKKDGVVGIGTAPLAAAPVGKAGAFSGDQAKQLGLAKLTAETADEVADLYQITRLRDDPLQGRPPAAFHYVLRGEIDGGTRESLGRVIADIKRQKGNILFLELQCGGADLAAGRAVADEIRKHATGDDAVLTVAVVFDQAADAAVFAAFGCSDIVMSRRKDAQDANRPEDNREAEIGDFSALVGPAAKTGGVDATLHRQSLRQLAVEQGYPALLADGMLDPNLEILRVRGATDKTRRRLMSREDFEADKANWVADGTVKRKGQLLKLNATVAGELGLAKFVVENRDMKEVYTAYGLERARVREATPGWLDRLAEFLRNPAVTILLVLVGFTGLILEIKVPGLTVPGILAALCFILVFWSHTQFSGQVAILAGMIFLLGLVLILLEVFVLPGFGAPGVVGILCMLAGLALVTVDHVPQTWDDAGAIGGRVGQYLLAMIGAVVLAVLIGKFLPNIPYANRMMLAPPAEGPGDGESLPGADEASALLGAIGTANTVLRPAGVVRFADKFVDVVSEGGYIPAGARVQVVEVEGTRIVVKEV